MVRWPACVVLFVLALALRATYLGVARPEPEMPGLQRKYAACAEQLAEGSGFLLQPSPPIPFVDRIPGYVVVLAVLRWLVGTGPGALALAHAALASLQAPLAALVGARLLRPGVGVVAGLLVAAWPPFLASDVQRLETGACGVAVLAGVLALSRHADRPGAGTVGALAASAVALVALRPDTLLLPLVLAGVAAFIQRERRAPLLAVVLLPAVLAAGWAVRNARVADGAFVSVGLGTNLLAAVGESLGSSRPLFGDAELARSEGHPSLYWPEPKRRDAARVREALGLIGRHPGAYATGCVRRVAVLLSLASGDLFPAAWFGGGPPLRQHVRERRRAHSGEGRYAGLLGAAWSYAREQPGRAAATLAWGPALAVLAASGCIALRRRRRDLAAVLCLPAYGLLVHVPLHAEPRYFLPYAPVLAVLAARAIMGAGRP
jgi:hypothetical protein